MTDHDLLDPGANWCPDCGLPRGVCLCEASPVIVEALGDVVDAFLGDVRLHAARFAESLNEAIREHELAALETDYFLQFGGEDIFPGGIYAISLDDG